MTSSIVPSPPGFSVAFADQATRTFGPPATSNVFAIGFADRGDHGQIASVSDITDQIGPLASYSPLWASIATVLAEGASLVTYARLLGPGAQKTSKTLSGSITITAKTPGAWGNNLTYEITQPATGQRRITIRESGSVVATSPAATTVQQLVDWSDDDDNNGVVDIGTGAALPSVTAETALGTNGTDDRGNITATEYQAALDKLDRRYGPGRFMAPGIDDPDVHALIAEHCAKTNRRARLDLDSSVTKSQAETYAQGFASDNEDISGYAGVVGSWAYTVPVINQPERLVPYSAVQIGVEARVEKALGIATPTFGPTNAYATTVTRLFKEWSDADRSELYASNVNVATDDGQVVSLWGFKSLSPVALDQDLHQQTIRMGFQFDAEAVMRGLLGAIVDKDTLASMGGKLDALARTYQTARAINGSDGDPGYQLIIDEINTPTTMARRELHAQILARFGDSTDWADLLVTVVPINQAL